MLAAIVFTDVVGFSKLAAQNEARVYVALQRDMGVMTNLCQAHGGQVLNTMGDGMLLYFSSAVDALSCAVEIQRTLYNQSHSLPSVEVLHHRIGVHLGDVIMSGDNVFGDGVNVAARLQAFAKPDAICFSGTVYEVVKNKLKFDALYLGPQSLKNLGEPVKIWQIPPLGDKSAASPEVGQAVAESAARETATGASGAKGVLMVVVSVVLVGGLIFAFTRMKAPKPDFTSHRPKATKSTKTTEEATPSTEPISSGPASSVRSQIRELKKSYAFDQIAALLEKNPGALETDPQALDTYRQLAEMQTFVGTQLSLTSGSLPVETQIDGQPVGVFMQGGTLTFLYSDPEQKQPSEMTPKEYLGIIQALVAKPVNGTAPAGSSSWAQLFSKEYSLAVSP